MNPESHDHEKMHLLPSHIFLQAILKNISIALIILSVSLFGGMLGYHFIEKLAWIDAFENAAMILSGMGPVNDMHTNAGKLFAGIYALFSGVIFLIAMALVLTPVFHRLVVKLHLKSK